MWNFRDTQYLNLKRKVTHPSQIKMNKPTDALNSNFIGITTVHVSGSLSAHHQEFLALRQLWYIMGSKVVRSEGLG
jgi:hypothetical protein